MNNVYVSFYLVSDRPTLRDLVNFVVPQACAKWYNLGLQLFNPRDEGILTSMKKETSKSSEDHCTEVFHHWLTTKKNATWNKLITSLKSRSVNLPNVARDVGRMLDIRVSSYTSSVIVTIADTIIIS